VERERTANRSSCFNGGSETDKMDTTARVGRLGKAKLKRNEKGGRLDKRAEGREARRDSTGETREKRGEKRGR
jgi:hypothetical protein